MSSTLLHVALCFAPSPSASDESPNLLIFKGRLDPRDERGITAMFRSHYVAHELQSKVHWVIEDVTAKSPWGRFGSLVLNKDKSVAKESDIATFPLEFDGQPREITLRSPIYADVGRIAEKSWRHRQLKFQVVAKQKIAGEECSVITVSNDLGLQETHWVDPQSGILMQYEQVVFLGQGVEHRLRVTLDEAKMLKLDALDRAAKAQAQLALVRENREKLGDAKIVEELKKRAEGIAKELDDGTYVRLADDLVDFTQSQLDQSDSLRKIAKKLEGQDLPKLKLTDGSGKPIDWSRYKGTPLVLHFWDYRADPLVAPYGETGYLDFLFRKLKKYDLHVLGVAVDRGLRDPKRRASAKKQIDSFVRFMNLSYPVSFDENEAVEMVGDPRNVGGELPLYLVVDGNGKVAAYHSGSWSKNPDEGLKELNELIIGLLP